LEDRGKKNLGLLPKEGKLKRREEREVPAATCLKKGRKGGATSFPVSVKKVETRVGQTGKKKGGLSILLQRGKKREGGNTSLTSP